MEEHLSAPTANRPPNGAAPVGLTKPKGSYRHGDLRNALIVTAKELTLQRGDTDFTLREIAGRTGVRHAAVYRHFESKGALLSEIARLVFEQLAGELETAAKNGEAPAAVAAVSRRYMAFAVERPGEYRMLARAFETEPGYAAALCKLLRIAIERAPAVRAKSPADVQARLLFAQLHGLATLRVSDVYGAEDGQACADALAALWR
ncbi:MAG: TetR/AcrR family transcriptional regulator [Hyphomicrobiales bacterium]|nr:TetR/AcrR family transcriptional regulator [Hyphomicrobiales bacterium]